MFLPDEFKVAAIQLYYDSLEEKLGPILGSRSKAQETLVRGLATKRCLAAICDQSLIGVLGIQTDQGGILNSTLKHMTRAYGLVGGVLRFSGLALLNHRTLPDELYIDGVAVAGSMRGKGIGSQLIKLLDKIASENRVRTVSLEVIDSNPRAKALYERLGFMAVKRRTIWPLNLFFEFPFQSATLMVKRIGLINDFSGCSLTPRPTKPGSCQ